MTDVTVKRDSYLPADRPWLLHESSGNGQPVPTDSGKIDYAKFTKNTHYPNGFIPSGVALGRVTTGGKLGPYDNAASDGRQTCVGHLYNSVTVPADTSATAAVAFVDCFVVVSESRLPAGHGLDAAAKAELPLIKYRA